MSQKLTDDPHKFKRTKSAGRPTANRPSLVASGGVSESVMSENPDPSTLLSVLEALNRGDFDVRFPAGEGERPGRVGELLNQIIGRNRALTAELERLAGDVDRDASPPGEAEIADASGGWRKALDSVNSLIRGLSHPRADIERIIRKAEEIKRLNGELEQRVLERTRALEAANTDLQVEIAERTRAEEEVRRLNSDLEERVRARTAELRERTTQLEAVNRELEAFGYSITHDLRGPLRRIHAFSALLLERCLAMLDSEGQDYVRRISSSSLRMEQLIEDMLDLTSATHQDLDREPVDLSAIVRQILDEHRSAHPDHPVHIYVQDEVVATGDPRMLRMVLENLLDNAWKFSFRQPEPVIEFRATGVDGRPVYQVRDNGVGFDASQAEVLFDPFRRLRGDYDGVGIGLSTVKRIIARHGGRIWAESEPGRGAAFFFTLA